MRLAPGLGRAIHIVQAQHAENELLRAEIGDAALQQAANGIAHVEMHQPPRRARRRQRIEQPDIGEFRHYAAAGGIMGEGHARREDAIEEPFQDGRKIEPPLREDKNEPIGRPQPGYGIGDGRGIVGHVEISAAFRLGQARIEILGIEIEQIDDMAGGFQGFASGARHRGGKAFRQRMGKHQQDPHRQNRVPCFVGSAGFALRFLALAGGAPPSVVIAPTRPSANSMAMPMPAERAAACETGLSSSSRMTA
ncbi:hypothetical protein RHECNPAF_2530029 [Rhizobium etli CNPAF512]|nr:hypothetical protein RHECNPAF_2530029 [Rhizobium etli CNPAF512]